MTQMIVVPMDITTSLVLLTLETDSDANIVVVGCVLCSLRNKKKKIECLINGDHNTGPPPAGRHGYLRATKGTRSEATMLITTGPPP